MINNVFAPDIDFGIHETKSGLEGTSASSDEKIASNSDNVRDHLTVQDLLQHVSSIIICAGNDTEVAERPELLTSPESRYVGGGNHCANKLDSIDWTIRRCHTLTGLFIKL
jgi:hypothetical protein